MPASSEIRFKIGADTSALSGAFVKAQSIAATAGKQIQKRFDMKELTRGLMTGIGIGSVDAVADMIVRPFQIAAERAKDMVGLTRRLREITTEEIVANGGRKTAIDAMHKQVRDLNVDIEMQQKLVDSLNTPQAKILGPDADKMRAAEQELVGLKVQQAELQSRLNVELAATKRASAEWAREQITLEKIADAELRDAGQREKLQIRLNALQREYALLVKRGDVGTDKERNNVAQQFAIQNQMRLLNKQATEERAATLVSLGGQLAGKDPARLSAPRQRGRSEIERIADRGQQQLNSSEEAIRTGRSPNFVASLAKKGSEDLKKVGEKIQQATSKVPNETSKALENQLIKANLLLGSIDMNLKPVKIKPNKLLK